MLSITVKEFSPSDFDAWSDLLQDQEIADGFAQSGLSSAPTWSKKMFETFLRELASVADLNPWFGVFLGASNSLIGIAELRLYQNQIWCYMILAQDTRGQGFGTMALKKLGEIAKVRFQAEHMYAYRSSKNHPCVGLTNNLGFETLESVGEYDLLRLSL